MKKKKSIRKDKNTGLFTMEELEGENTTPIKTADFYEDIMPEVKEGIVSPVVKNRSLNPFSGNFKNKTLKIPYWSRRKLKKKPDMSFLIKMKFSNGTSKYFVIATREELFTYKKRSYYLRYEDAWFNINTNQYELEYFDDSPVPISKKIIKKGNKAFHMVNPENLKPLFEMRKAELLASDQNIDKIMRNLMMIGIFTALLLLLCLFLIYRQGKMIGALQII